ncbi:hypothetical protein KO504_01535 [Winogradskyella psychrotolerans]|uniref:hypothetical protein n=1 Tax=Winogradskyella psychrotolerans TaxID=1344585 RepID=UPI001C0712BD|nr:hypothetical protein [Winogradskyella psychrotolerans]MBU2920011.1 hypothetical protein [Winogradskyella psychrotolerans]
MRYIYLLIILTCFSCSNERVLHLPEIEQAEVTEVLDVSPAYIFYDETQADSTLLNRKNLIISTNWLVNVDKRLTLKQAIPHIKFIQDKKRNAEMHKNEDAKNYFTCNDTSIGNLGFLEFTDVFYEFSEPIDTSINLQDLVAEKLKNNQTSTSTFLEIPLDITNNNKDKIQQELQSYIELLALSTSISEDMVIKGYAIDLYFDERMSFQDYISVKSKLSKIKSEKIIITNNEFIY